MTQQEKLWNFVHFLLLEVITCEFEIELHNWNIILRWKINLHTSLLLESLFLQFLKAIVCNLCNRVLGSWIFAITLWLQTLTKNNCYFQKAYKTNSNNKNRNSHCLCSKMIVIILEIILRKFYNSDKFKFENCSLQIHHFVKLSDDSLSDISRKDNKKTSIFCDRKKTELESDQ